MTWPFASPAWVDEARKVLEGLVAAHGEEGRTFSVCERFTNAPTDIFPSGLAAWHFRIDGRSVVVDVGVIEDADAQIAADYAAALPIARMIYTPEFLAEREARRKSRPAKPGAEQARRAPAYMVDLHNEMAARTA